MDQLKVLLVEDNPGDAFLIKFYLEEFAGSGYDLSQAESLADAFAMLSAEKFDVILLDLGLPDSNGTVDTLKSVLDKYPNNLVIVMTGLQDEDVGIASVKAGAQDFLVKGRFDGKVLNSALRYSFERFRLNKRLQELDFSKSLLDEVQIVASLAYFEYGAEDERIQLSEKFEEALQIQAPENSLSRQEFINLVDEPNAFMELMDNAGRQQSRCEEQFRLKANGKRVRIFLKPMKPAANGKNLVIGAMQLAEA